MKHIKKFNENENKSNMNVEEILSDFQTRAIEEINKHPGYWVPQLYGRSEERYISIDEVIEIIENLKVKYLRRFNESETPDWAKGLSLKEIINNPEHAGKFLSAVYKGRFYNSKGEGDKQKFKEEMELQGFKEEDIQNFLNKI